MSKQGNKVPYETYSQLCTDLDLANVKIERLEKIAREMLSYFTNAREGFMGDHRVKYDISANVKFVDKWIEALKEK